LDHYITATELAVLLGIFWAPVFALAAIPQWRVLSAYRRRAIWLFSLLIVECAVALGIWVSPLHRYLLQLDFPGGLSVGSMPLQAAVASSIVVTALVWLVVRCDVRRAT
jgi:hypothetical protein